MRLFIPAIGTKIKLTAPWTFTLNVEYRNSTLYDVFSEKPLESRWEMLNRRTHQPKKVTLPVDLVLMVDRIYIKKPSPEYNSVTLRIPKKCGNPPHFESCRFWVKLDDANKIECEIV